MGPYVCGLQSLKYFLCVPSQCLETSEEGLIHRGRKGLSCLPELDRWGTAALASPQDSGPGRGGISLSAANRRPPHRGVRRAPNCRGLPAHRPLAWLGPGTSSRSAVDLLLQSRWSVGARKLQQKRIRKPLSPVAPGGGRGAGRGVVTTPRRGPSTNHRSW